MNSYLVFGTRTLWFTEYWKGKTPVGFQHPKNFFRVACSYHLSMEVARRE